MLVSQSISPICIREKKLGSSTGIHRLLMIRFVRSLHPSKHIVNSLSRNIGLHFRPFRLKSFNHEQYHYFRLTSKLHYSTDAKNFSDQSKSSKEKEKQSDDAENMLRFANIAKPEWKMVLGAIVLLFISSAVTMSVPLCIGTIIDITMEKEDGEKNDINNIPSPMPNSKGIRDMIKSIGSIEIITGVFVGVFFIGSLANTGRYAQRSY